MQYFNGNFVRKVVAAWRSASRSASRNQPYCPADHALFITTRDIGMAYRYGDAALAFIIAHEYAHAMQTAFRFMPGYTPLAELQADCLAGVYLGSMPNVSVERSDLGEIGASCP